MNQTGTVMRFFRGAGLAQHQPDWRRLITDIDSLALWVKRRKRLTATQCERCSTGDCHTKPDSIGKNSPSNGDRKAPILCKDGRLSYGWFEILENCLLKAREAADKHDIASGYEYLHIAERESVAGMTPAERKVRAQSLRAEVDKKAFKGSWRAETIKQLLGKDDSEVSVESLAEAIGHKNTLDRNDHRKSDKIRWQLAWLGLIVCGLVLIAFGATISGMTQKFEHQGVSLLPYCIYLGLLGGFLSSAISVRGTDQKTRVPEIEVSFYAAIARGLLGAAASIPVFVIGKLGLINLGGAFDGQESKPWGLLLLCFISGFSERWFLTTIATVFRDDNRQPGSEEKQLRESAVAVGQGGASQQTERKCSCGDSKSEYFRAGIGALIVDRNGRILTFKRSGSDGHEWQLPQGGLLPGEAPCQALFREIEEETSIPPEKLQIIDEMKEWLGYELPVNCKTLKTQHGQVQKWFLLLYVDVDTDIRPDGSEFIEGRWMTPAELLRFAVPFRLPVYQRIIDRWSAHFADSAGQPRTSP